MRGVSNKHCLLTFFIVHYFMSILVLPIILTVKREPVALLTVVCLPGVLWLLCDSSSSCHGFVCSLWLWFFLITLIFSEYMHAESRHFCTVHSVRVFGWPLRSGYVQDLALGWIRFHIPCFPTLGVYWGHLGGYLRPPDPELSNTLRCHLRKDGHYYCLSSGRSLI